MKKALLILIALLLCLSLFACDNIQIPGNDNGGSIDTEDKPSTEAEIENKPDTGDNTEPEDETKPPESMAVATVTEEQWKAAFENFDSLSFSVSMTIRVNELKSQIRTYKITDDAVHISYDELECYSQKLINDSYVTYIKQADAEKFIQLNDVSGRYFEASKQVPFISFSELFGEFAYNAELGAYVCEESIKASYHLLTNKDNASELNCSSTVIRFKDGKLAQVSTVASETTYVYSDIEDNAVKIPDSVVNGAIRETSISLDKSDITIKLGDTVDDTVTLIATTAPEVDPSDLIWTSSNPSVATVSDIGVVTAVSCGTTTITVKVPGGFAASCRVEVIDVIIPDGAPTYNVTWERTELMYAITDEDSEELESGCKKFYSGTELTGAYDMIDEFVFERNLAAARQANVLVRFDYSTVAGGWGQNIATIVAKATVLSSQSPDIYACFVYDLSCAQLRGCFANLLQTDTANCFRFVQPDYNPTSDNYFDAKSGEGYFFEYMKSLSLSDDKMFILASNYCVDLIRSMLVVPMNVEQMATLVGEDEATGENLSYTGDMTQVSDFYDLVWRTQSRVSTNEKYAEGFTYDVIAHYAEKFYSQADASDVLSGKVAFAVGSGSGLPATGLLYSTSVEIIHKAEDESNPDQYTYSYPTDNPSLKAFSESLTNLFKNRDGVLAVSKGDAGTESFGTELLAIRSNFAAGNVLFGGVIALGSLDTEDYQKMQTEGQKMGFGILPVPLYRAADANGTPEEYNTVIHNIGKAITIGKNSTKFSQCTAYLDYLSRMSNEIVDEYYESKLVSNVQGFAAAFNENMLTYIRNHVRNCFDKTIEDSVASFIASSEGNTTATELKLHNLICSNKYNYPNLYIDYQSSAYKKTMYLRDVVNTWNSYND
ncbi:MAG: Ig domain-containing protein [Clostridia bacterium]|nr:Ig domain-containing protein [Clostridia bacterium]